jgi:ABC-type polysaccharide transport system permease subunit
LLISAPVYPVADILDTLSLRLGITGMDFPLGAAVGMIKAVLGSIFIFVTNYVSKKLVDDSGIF